MSFLAATAGRTAMRASSNSFWLLLGVALVFSAAPCQGIAAPTSWFSSRQTPKQHKLNRKRNIFSKALRAVTTGVIDPGPTFVHHSLYWMTAADAVQYVFFNEYSGFFIAANARSRRTVYSKLFVFARLRPRLLFSVGALLRALQLCTPLCRVIDPSIGVGAGINLCALLAGSRWVKPVVLGWATTKWAWVWLGARQLERAFVPITLSIHEWDDRQKRKKKEEGDDKTYKLG
eukprot:scaffold2816_cov121-Cylindrotheca_fusiformis.AAC.23